MKTPKHDWYLPLLSGGEARGLNDAGIESFKDPRHLARETVQNIIDAQDPSSKGPATVHFEILDLPAVEFPECASFKNIFEACNKVVKQDADARAVSFMKSGSSLLASRSSMKVLRIRDENTTGLDGSDDDPSSRWYRLVRGQGTARSEGAGGGTYGIGQRAPFAFSGIRTIFYSTMVAGEQRRFMGKFILCSCDHPDQKVPTQNIGYFGEHTGRDAAPVKSITDPGAIPAFFRRQTIGTDVYIMGFTLNKLGKVAIRSVLIDFYAAILHEKVVVVVQDGSNSTRIDRKTIQKWIADELNKPDLDASEKAELKMAHFGVEAMMAGSPYEECIKKLGKVKLFVCRSDDATNKVSYMRSPRMRIQSKSCNKLRGYQAVVLVDEDLGNEYLKNLENPEHDIWHHEQAAHWSDAERREAKQVLRALYKFVRDKLEQIRGESSENAEDIPELSRFLPAEDDDLGDETLGPEESNDHVKEETPRKIPRTSQRVAVVASEDPRESEMRIPKPGEGDGDEEGPNGPLRLPKGKKVRRRKKRNGPGDEGGDGPGGRALTRRDVGFRSWKPSGASMGTYIIVVSPRTDSSGSLVLRAMGETAIAIVDIRAAKDLDSGQSQQVSGGRITPLVLKKDTPRRFEITIDSDVDVALALEGS
jgi:hypothetical protein